MAERTRNKLCCVSVEFVYVAVRLAWQWIKERGIFDVRVRAKRTKRAGSFGVWLKVTLYSVG